MAIIVGVDIGVSSVGWAVVNENYEVLESGANLFSEATAAMNINRRTFRQGRRLKRRRHTRVSDFRKLWQKSGLEIPSEMTNNQLALRVKGISEKLSISEIYYVLYNMLLHRGISYLEDAMDENDTGTDYKRGLLRNQQELQQKLPCQIQFQRQKEYGKYRGNTVLEEKGQKIILSNVFTTSAYQKELEVFFDTQKKYHSFLTENFITQYQTIYLRKRAYYHGPGTAVSRSDYGIYTTKIDVKTGEYITENNIFEKLIGTCSVYNGKDGKEREKRAAAASYTAQEFNLLNDLNNLTINGRKLEKDEKEQIVEIVKTANSIHMRRIIQKVMGEPIESMTGARIDKKEKEIFHKFEQYNKLRKVLEKSGYNIKQFTREDLDYIGEVLTLNTDRESIMPALQKYFSNMDEHLCKILCDFRKNNSSLFSKWHSFSVKLMLELIPEMYEQPKEQMALLTEMGVFKTKLEKYKGYRYIPKKIAVEGIYNPVVRRSVGIAIEIMNAIIKKYGYPDKVVIEMARDKNSEEAKKRIKEEQDKYEKELSNILKRIQEDYGIKIQEQDFKNQKQLALKLKLWNEQNACCVYSGKKIELDDLLKRPYLFEIDHVIPKSISYDDSRTNKVLVYEGENREKGNKTPYGYLSIQNRDWGFEEFRNHVLTMKKDGRINSAKVKKLLFMEDITKVEVLQGFIARNLNDTRYASRVVLNTLQQYFEAKEAPTKVRVIRGSFTSQMRKNLGIKKDREESYAHHAVDAMIMCYSQMGMDAFRQLQEQAVDFEQKQIIDQEKWRQVMNETVYNEVIYQAYRVKMKKNIAVAQKKIKYWHKVDKKVNRGLCKQTIRGTRTIEGKTYKVYKLDIRTNDGYKKFINLATEKKRENLLVYRNDPQTYEELLKICETYRDQKNPFVAYEQETGDYVRKYAKKHNGPRINCLKYLEDEVGSCIDISHKYGYQKGDKKVILEGTTPYRMDVYYHSERKKYYFVGIKHSDCRCEKGKWVISMEEYEKRLLADKVLKPGQKHEDIEELGFEFLFSVYKNDIIEYERNGEKFVERFLSRTGKETNCIETKPMDADKFESGQRQVKLAKTKEFNKIRFDILGNPYRVDKEKFQLAVDR